MKAGFLQQVVLLDQFSSSASIGYKTFMKHDYKNLFYGRFCLRLVLDDVIRSAEGSKHLSVSHMTLLCWVLLGILSLSQATQVEMFFCRHMISMRSLVAPVSHVVNSR